MTIPIINVPGSEAWRDAYTLGGHLGTAFPGQDADDLCYAFGENDPDPLTFEHLAHIVALTMTQQGERDERDWVWKFTLDDGRSFTATGGCDYMGWDCRSWLSVEVSA